MDCSNCGCTLNIKDNKLFRLNQISAGTQTPGNWRDLQDSEAIMDLEGKKIFITGVGRGIGRALALECAKQGAEVYGVSVTQANVDSLKAENPKIRAYCMDITNWSEFRGLLESLPTMDGLVNNAGTNVEQSVLDITEENYDKITSLNVKPALNASQIFARRIVEEKSENGGSIVNISSIAGNRALPNHLVYCASKSALQMMGHCMAMEFGKHKIRVNSVCPTVVLTDLGRYSWGNPAKSVPMLAKHPLEKFADEKHVVDAVIFLLSDKSEMITGTDLPVDAGFLCC